MSGTVDPLKHNSLSQQTMPQKNAPTRSRPVTTSCPKTNIFFDSSLKTSASGFYWKYLYATYSMNSAFPILLYNTVQDKNCVG